ncbi:MAG: RluA family pseudouridine synthase [Planctomycetota bacterium]|jgi:23S rRNA pseudouridine1911/1915/1917 synthase|nr:RluA family pseudouridine synthase [Planctomycetota bacterium]
MTPALRVDEDTDLKAFFRRRLPEWKPSTLRQRLAHGLVFLDGEAVFRGDVRLAIGQEVRILSRPADPNRFFPTDLGKPPLDILYADSALVAVDKPSGLLSVASEREKNCTAIRLMRDWLVGLRRREDGVLHAAHRLDRDASGVLLFARSLDVRRRLAAEWHNFDKTYLAVVDGVPSASEGSIDLPLREDRALFVRGAENGGGTAALTHYRLIRRSGCRSLLEVRLDTGRKHQIRVHLAHIGCPVAGDRRYGVSKAPRLALHAGELRLSHPDDGRELIIRARTPEFFNRLLKGRT